jgi:hypothetical protein
VNKYYPDTAKIKIWLLRLTVASLLSLCLLLLFYAFNKGPKNHYSKTGKSVSIEHQNGRFNFYKNGNPFIVKGGAGFTHIEELVNAGGNTIICWDTSRLENTFKEAAKNNVAVIIGLDIPGGNNLDFYNKDSNTNLLQARYKQIVSRYKDQSALLAWCLGNEIDMPLTFTTVPFYKTYNRLLETIHQIDPDHPVSTSTINVAKRCIFNICWRIPALDFICINTYNRIKSIETDLGLIKWIWNGPYLIGEWSPNGGWEAPLTTWQAPIENTSTKKAEQYAEFYTKYMPRNDPRFLGSMVFYWGNRQEYTHTWYSIFNEDGTPTETLEVLNDCWKDTVTKHQAPRLQYMLVDKLSRGDNIIIAAGTQHQATVFFDKPTATDTLVYQWQIVKEGWQQWGHTWDNFKKPAVQTGLMTDSSHSQINFKAPAGEGPYRIFVTIKNPAGFCATANIPFYVVQ